MEALVATSQEVRFVGEGKAEIYARAEKVLVEQEYAAQGKKGRGVVRRTWPN